jgi:hypothetical protein
MIRKLAWTGLFLIAVAGYAGGPPILTISKIPEYFVVGKPDSLVFVVRTICCDNGPLTDRSYTVRAAAPGHREISVPAVPTGNAGEYTAALTLPAVGEWTMNVYYSGNDLQVAAAAAEIRFVR